MVRFHWLEWFRWFILELSIFFGLGSFSAYFYYKWNSNFLLNICTPEIKLMSRIFCDLA